MPAKNVCQRFLYTLSSLNHLLKNTAELPNFYPSYLGITLILSLDLHTPLSQTYQKLDKHPLMLFVLS